MGEPSARISHGFPLKGEGISLCLFCFTKNAMEPQTQFISSVPKQGLGNASEIQTWAVLLLCISERCPGTLASAPAGCGRCLDQGLGCLTWEAEEGVPRCAPSGFLAASLLAKPPLALSIVSFISCSSSSCCCLPFPALVSILQGTARVSCGGPPLEQTP